MNIEHGYQGHCTSQKRTFENQLYLLLCGSRFMTYGRKCPFPLSHLVSMMSYISLALRQLYFMFCLVI